MTSSVAVAGDGVICSPTSIRILVGGEAEGSTLALDEPLSFWGGFEAETGAIIDQRHPQAGTVITGDVVVMSGGRGSSSASSVIAEAIRLGTAPAAIIMAEADEIVALGAIVADELYDLQMPVLVADSDTFDALRASSVIRVSTIDS